MASRRTKKAKSVPAQMMELAFAAPQVVAHRLTRMARAGAKPSARDAKEFQRMGTEKVAAFAESWSAMAFAALHNSQALTTALLTPPGKRGLKAQASAARRASAGALDIMEKGLAPIHRRAVANAKRLSRSKGK